MKKGQKVTKAAEINEVEIMEAAPATKEEVSVEEVKTEVVKAEKKPAAKKAPAKAAVEARVIFQGYGFELEPKVILDHAKEAWLAKGHKESEIKSIELYIKPEEWAAYYVINGELDPENKISLS